MNLNTDQEILRSYLLGTLEPEAQAELEERILSDPPTYEELSLLEEELIDQYVANGLSKTEQRLFETNFLITEERQKNLQFGQLLKRYLTSQAVSASAQKTRAQQAKRRPSAKGFLAPLASAVIAVAVLGIGLLCWLAVKQLAVQQTSSRVVVVPLTPGTDGSQGDGTKRLTVPPHGFNVKLELEVVTHTSFQNYKSELFRENKRVQTDALRIETKGAQRIVPLTITGQMLSPGEYQVKLSGVSESGQDEFIDNYTFRVTK